ncbi:hypothetical protein D9K77_19085 [Klebsiella pneumoniae]|nr:recombinase family protein [Klebsiella pneumoniae]RLL15309.1 hypothetical protein D9K77_19085 [Klebsiella pneumoniae]
MSSVIAYVRVSTSDQTIENQKKQINEAGDLPPELDTTVS